MLSGVAAGLFGESDFIMVEAEGDGSVPVTVVSDC